MNHEEDCKRFKELTAKVERTGMDKLMAYLEGTDFFEAPSSAKFHLSVKGGLVRHNLNVYDCLCSKSNSPLWRDVLADISEDSFIVSALFHDICKTNFYKQALKNQKTYDADKIAKAEPWQIKHDSHGDYLWETIDSYEIDDEIPLGHGEKSVIMLSRFITLKREEMYAIRWHMGFADSKENYNAIGTAIEKYPFVLALIEADLEASKLLEDKDDNKEEALKWINRSFAE